MASESVASPRSTLRYAATDAGRLPTPSSTRATADSNEVSSGKCLSASSYASIAAIGWSSRMCTLPRSRAVKTMGCSSNDCSRAFLASWNMPRRYWHTPTMACHHQLAISGRADAAEARSSASATSLATCSRYRKSTLPRMGRPAYFWMSSRAGLMNMVGSESASIEAVPRRRLRPVAFVRGRAAVPLRAVLRALSIVIGRVACVPGRTNPDTGRPALDIGLTARLAPPAAPVSGLLKDVPGRGAAVATVLSSNITSAMPSSSSSVSSVATVSVRARALRNHAARSL
mmetsp:Transcript_13470/g.34558  ORF Transcript_13470/g.34558 Transcript_13470/m.34558 type:complete len:287 (+) Transcript_13470:595-1455(+)